MKKIKLSVLLILFTTVAFAQNFVDFTRFSNAWINGSAVDKEKSAPNAYTLNVNTFEINKAGWKPLLSMRVDNYQRGVAYIAEFDLECSEAEGRSHFLVQLKNITRNFDHTRLNGNEIGKFNRHYKKKFVIPNDSDEYKIEVWACGEVKGTFKNLKITEIEGGTTEDFLPMFANKVPYEISASEKPRGAKEFNVDLPNNPNGAVVLAKDFNILPNSPIKREDVLKCMNHCRKIKAAKLLFEKNATYTFFGDAHLEINLMKDFTLDGNGSTFIFRRSRFTSCWVANSERVVVENFNADWDEETDPLASIVRLEGYGKEPNGKRYIDFRFIHYDKHPSYGKYLRAAYLSPWDEKERAVGVEGIYGMSFEFQTGKEVPEEKWLAPNVLRIYREKSGPIGMLYRMQHYYYNMDFMTGVNNRHFTMRNVNVWATPGHAFLVVGKSDYNHFKNVKIGIKPNSSPRKCISSTADHFGAINCWGNIKLEDCEFADGADDCVNFHDKSSIGEVSGKNTLVVNSKGTIGANIELRNFDFSPARKSMRIISSKKLPNNKYEIAFDKELPKSKEGHFLLFDKSNNSNNMIVRNCTFRNNRAHGMLAQSSNITVENCKFIRNEMGAMKIGSGFQLAGWSEGRTVRNMVVRNCQFVRPNPRPTRVFAKEWCVFIGAYLYSEPPDEQSKYPIIKNVLFENNTFEDCYGMIACIGSAHNVIFNNNTFKNTEARKFPVDYRNCFYLRMAKNIKIVNNTFEKSPLLKDIGVYAEKGQYKNIIIQGNKLVDERK